MANTDTYSGTVVLPIGEVARLAGVTVGTVRNWERVGKIQSFRTPGNQRRFHLEDVKALITPVSTSPEVVEAGVSFSGDAA